MSTLHNYATIVLTDLLNYYIVLVELKRGLTFSSSRYSTTSCL